MAANRYRTVLALSHQRLKIIHSVRRGTSRTIDLMHVEPVAGLSEEEVLQWLKRFWSERGLEPGEVVVAVPEALTTLRTFTLPATDPKEVRAIVELQAERYTPYAKEEILTDWVMLESGLSGYSKVLVVVVHQDVVHRALRLLQGMGWPLERVGFELEGLGHWLRGAIQPDDEKGKLLVAEMERETTAVAVFQAGKLLHHRSLALGMEVLEEGSEAGPNRFVAEFQRTLEAFEIEGLDRQGMEIVLTGLATQMPAFGVTLQQALDLAVRVVPMSDGIPLDDRVRMDPQTLQAASFASLIGLALGDGTVDLTPKALRLERTFEIRSRAILQVGCQVLAGLLLVSFWMIGRAYEDQRYLAWLTQQQAKLAQEAKELSNFLDQVKMVEEWMAYSDELLEAMDELQKKTPHTIRWTSLAYQKGDRIHLKGLSPEVPKVFDFVAELKKSQRFSDVQARRTNPVKVQEEDWIEFEIVCTLRPPTLGVSG
jgi:Tfp pilus assembly protein PilN